MYIFMLVINILSIKLSYDIAKKNNYNVKLWTVLSTFTGYITVIILIIRNIINKISTKKELVLLPVLVIIGISTILYCKPTHIEKTYCGNISDGKKVIQKDITVTIQGKIFKDLCGRKQIDATMNLCNKKYILDILLTDYDHYTSFPTNEESHIELSPIYISKNFDSINITFDDSVKDYAGYTLSAVSSE